MYEVEATQPAEATEPQSGTADAIRHSPFGVPALSPVCALCKHLTDLAAHRCDAFPDEIPLEIWIGDNPHTEPFPGDNGIRFERTRNSGKQAGPGE